MYLIINTSRNKLSRATDLQLPYHAADEDSVERQQRREHGQCCQCGRADGLPQQHDTHRHHERHVPHRVYEDDEVVQLLRVHRHQVGDGADRGAGAGRGGQTQGLHRRDDRVRCQCIPTPGSDYCLRLIRAVIFLLLILNNHK